MDPIRNPYVPGAGTTPPELAGRAAILERARVLLARVRLGRPTKSFIAVGLRGVGKTVLLNRIRTMAQDASFRTCVIEAHDQKTLPELLLPELRRTLLDLDRLGALSEAVKRGLGTLKSFVSSLKLKYLDAELALDLSGETGRADSGDIEADLPELFIALGQAARDRDVAVAIIIDEIQYLAERDLSALIMAIHRVSQAALPIVLIGAGLPQVIALAGRSKSYAERLFDFPLVDALGRSDTDLALVGPARSEQIEFEPAALDRIAELTRGYPYFVQEWGYHTWNIAEGSPIQAIDVDRASSVVIQVLDESFFRVRFDRLTPRERDYLRAMAELGAGPHRSGDIAEQLGIAVTSAGPLRNGLIGKGMLYSPAHGDTAFTVPLFDEFMRRIVPSPPRRRADRAYH